MTTLVFPWPRPLLSANDRLHWAQKARVTRTIRGMTCLLARSARIPTVGHVTVRLVWEVRDNRRRDEDNAYPTFKAMCDGLVDAGVVPDDTPAFMTKLGPVIRRAERARVLLEVDFTDLGGDA